MVSTDSSYGIEKGFHWSRNDLMFQGYIQALHVKLSQIRCSFR